MKPRLQSKRGLVSLIKQKGGIASSHAVHGVFCREKEMSSADMAMVDGAYSMEEASAQYT